MKSCKPTLTAGVHRSHKTPGSKHIRKVMLSLDLAESDAFGADRCTPPLPVLTAFGDAPLHRFHLPRGRFDIDRLAREFASRIVRSDSGHSMDPSGDEQGGWRTVLFHLKGYGAWLHYENGSINTYAATRRKAMLLALKMERYLLKEKPTGGSFYLISNCGGMIDTEKVELDADTILSDEDLMLHYGPDAPDWFRDFQKKLTDNKTSLNLFQGTPGTGKTSALRHILGVLRKTHIAYYVPASTLEIIASGSFVSFWQSQKLRHQGKKTILLLEDAEQALFARSGSSGDSLVSNLLNLTSGMLGDFMATNVICSINCRYEDIDSALKRPGRLMVYKSFPLIGQERAHRLAAKIGRTLPPKKEYTLAEIYNADAAPEQDSKIIGFAA